MNNLDLKKSQTFDNAGNPTQGTSDDNKTHSNSFNNANRLSGVNVNGSLAATYNPLGQRVMKTLANGSKEMYHYDEAGQLIAVTDGAGTTVREYIYRGNQLISFVANGNRYYVHNDHLNTPQVVTNQSQQVVWMGDYEPFGKLTANSSNSIELFSRFPGQYLDQETNLYYNYFRDYDPSIGRYMESDPIGLEGGINTYAYVEGNPISNVDPFGLQTITRPLVPLIFPAPGAKPADDGFDHTDPFKLPNSSNNSSNESSSDSRIDSFPAQSEYLRYKDFCNSPPPQTGNKCTDLRAEINWMKQCRDARQEWDDRYKPGAHADAIRDLDRGIKRLTRIYNNSWSCKDGPLDCDL